MIKFAKKALLAVTLAATALASATPAMADPYYGGGGYRHHRGGDSTGAAIAGGIIGLALGAIIVSAANSNHNRDRYRSSDYRYQNQYPNQYRGQPTWQGAYNGDPYDQRYQGGQPGYSRDGYPRGNDGYYDRRGYRDPDCDQDGN